jgi:nucleotide-binding universal stress UspA family protein
MQWCANYAPVAGAKVTVVHAVEIGYSFYELGAGATAPFVAPLKTAVQLDELRDAIERDWCKPLADAGVSYRVVVANAQAAALVMDTAHAEHADLVVCGRRGRSGFVEAVLGSTSRELTHRSDLPLVIVP